MPKCFFCGSYTSSSIKVPLTGKLKEFTLNPKEEKSTCPDCFKVYCSADDDELVRRIKDNLFGITKKDVKG